MHPAIHRSISTKPTYLYLLRFRNQASAQSDTRNLSYDIILCSLGARYKSYCANVSRSFFINPPKKVPFPPPCVSR